MIGELIPTGVTFGAGRISVNDQFSGTAEFNNVEVSGNLSAGTGGAIYSGGTNLYNIFSNNLTSYWTAGTVANSIKTLNSNNTASGIASIALGSGTTASGNMSHSEGYSTTASGENSHAEGEATSSTNYGSHSEGGYTKSLGGYSHAEGIATTATGQAAHSEGSETTASNSYAHAEGVYSVASNTASHAEGSGSTASAIISHSEGIRTTASGNYSHSEGSYTKAIGASSHAEGSYTTATGDNSHAGGYLSISSGITSFAFGNGAQAIGGYSVALGNVCIASGGTSFVYGYNSRANAEGSIVLGWGLTGNTSGNTYVQGLNIKNVGAGPGTTDIGVDANGFVVNQASDERLKENINPIKDALQKVKDLRGVTYNWKDRNAGGNGLRYGFIAQEVNRVVPELTFFNENEYMGVHYKEVSALLVESIKELAESPKIPTYTPISSTDESGSEGQITRDDDYIYVKTKSGWKRTGLSSF